MKSNTPDSWGSVARLLHWTVASLIVLQFPLGWIGGDLENSPFKVNWMITHKSLGVTILLLMLARLLWRMAQATPHPPAGTPPWQERLAAGVHWSLYAVVLATTLAGWVIADTSRIPWKWWWYLPLPDFLPVVTDVHEAAEDIHEALGWVLFTVLAVHVAAALWHHFVRRDEVLRRMWTG